jgi:hypothetical protein
MGGQAAKQARVFSGRQLEKYQNVFFGFAPRKNA